MSCSGCFFKPSEFSLLPPLNKPICENLSKSRTGIRDAIAFGPMCHQNENKPLHHNEDCLQLNVWTPKRPVKSPVPVMVWIHGEGNTAGSGRDAAKLARHFSAGTVENTFICKHRIL